MTSLRLIDTLHPGIRKYAYDLEEYPFPSLVAAMYGFEVKDLQHLYDQYKSRKGVEFSKYRTVNGLIDEFRGKMDPVKGALEGTPGGRFRSLYDQFLCSAIEYENDGPYMFGSLDIIFHAQGSNAYPYKYHVDRTGSTTITRKHMGIYLPLTEARSSSTVQVVVDEEKPDQKIPLDSGPGEFYIWDSANLRHGTDKNCEPYGRLALHTKYIMCRDLEGLEPIEDYDPIDKEAIRISHVLVER